MPERPTSRKQVDLFSHLKQYDRSVPVTERVTFSSSCKIHPAILRVGLQISEGRIAGSTETCVGMLRAFKAVVRDYVTPPEKELSRDLNTFMKPCITFLGQCRPLTASMGNAIKAFKHEVTHEIPLNMAEEDAKRHLFDFIDRFIEERILLAQVQIAHIAGDKICDGDTILVHGSSALMVRVLVNAHQQNKRFSVVVIDSRPQLTGKDLVRTLDQAGIRCTYALISSVSYLMRGVSRRAGGGKWGGQAGARGVIGAPPFSPSSPFPLLPKVSKVMLSAYELLANG